MKSNDSIPEDEMLLAAGTAEASARGLGHLVHGLFADGGDVHNDRTKPVNRCCAYGALVLAGIAPHSYMNAPDGLRAVGLGNDDWSKWSVGDADQGETLGHAFRLFMTQHESDPDTERLIAERSAK